MNKKTLFLILLVAFVLPLVSFAATDPCTTIKAFVKLTTQIGAAIVIIGWVITGILYLTAGGGPRMEIAKKSMIACVIGTVLIIIAPIAYDFVNGALSIGGAGAGACP